MPLRTQSKKTVLVILTENFILDIDDANSVKIKYTAKSKSAVKTILHRHLVNFLVIISSHKSWRLTV